MEYRFDLISLTEGCTMRDGADSIIAQQQIVLSNIGNTTTAELKQLLTGLIDQQRLLGNGSSLEHVEAFLTGMADAIQAWRLHYGSNETTDTGANHFQTSWFQFPSPYQHEIAVLEKLLKFNKWIGSIAFGLTIQVRAYGNDSSLPALRSMESCLRVIVTDIGKWRIDHAHYERPWEYLGYKSLNDMICGLKQQGWTTYLYEAVPYGHNIGIKGKTDSKQSNFRSEIDDNIIDAEPEAWRAAAQQHYFPASSM